jgi:hypothetical protein
MSEKFVVTRSTASNGSAIKIMTVASAAMHTELFGHSVIYGPTTKEKCHKYVIAFIESGTFSVKVA